MEKTKKRRLKLAELKVQSFVTELRPGMAHTAKGGDDDTANALCTIISGSIVSSIIGNSAGSKWPCTRVCPILPPPDPGPGTSEAPPIPILL